jgi:predicted nucleic acid-binding Zn ribbon protein
MTKQELKNKIIFNTEDQKNIITESESLSEASNRLMGTKSTLGRYIVKELCEEFNIPYPSKQKVSKYCLCCGSILEKTQNKFCSHSCAAKYNNKNTHKKTKLCKYCGKLIENRKTFCDSKCYNEYLKKQQQDKWENGEYISEYVPDFIRDFLVKKYNNKCQKCGWGEINTHTNKVPLQIHHIDGDCTNNVKENLELLCPNCHSLTKTFGNLNKGNSRRYKRKEKRKNK